MALVRRPSLLAVGLLTLAMAGAPGRLGHAEAQLATPPSMPSAHVWVSTPDGTHRMDDWGTVAFHRGGSSKLTITVDPSLRYQRWTGSGRPSPTRRPRCSTALDPATRDATMRDLFVTRRDCRSCASRSVRRTSSTARTTPSTTCRPGRPTTRSTHFSIDHDKAEILPLLRQALALNPTSR